MRVGGEHEWIARRANVRGVMSITMSSSYATGGDACDLRSFAGGRDPVYVSDFFNGTYWLRYDYVNRKMMAYTASGTQVSATTNLSAVAARVLVIW